MLQHQHTVHSQDHKDPYTGLKNHCFYRCFAFLPVDLAQCYPMCWCTLEYLEAYFKLSF